MSIHLKVSSSLAKQRAKISAMHLVPQPALTSSMAALLLLCQPNIFFKLLGVEHWQGMPRGKNKIKQYECALVLMHSLPKECNYDL